MWSLYSRYHQTYRENRPQRTWVTNTSESYKRRLEKENVLALVGTNAFGHQLHETGAQTDQPEESTISNGTSTPQSHVSSEHSRDSAVYAGTKELFRELHQMSRNQAQENYADQNLQCLETDTGDAWIRSQTTKHLATDPRIERTVEARFARNIGIRPKDRSRFIKRQATDLVHRSSFSVAGLDPSIDISTQLSLLKISEKELLLNRWRDVWESVRPPKPKWYEMKGATFSKEMSKCRNLLVHKEIQELEQTARLKLLELHRMIQMDLEFSDMNQGDIK